MHMTPSLYGVKGSKAWHSQWHTYAWIMPASHGLARCIVDSAWDACWVLGAGAVASIQRVAGWHCCRYELYKDLKAEAAFLSLANGGAGLQEMHDAFGSLQVRGPATATAAFRHACMFAAAAAKRVRSFPCGRFTCAGTLRPPGSCIAGHFKQPLLVLCTEWNQPPAAHQPHAPAHGLSAKTWCSHPLAGAGW
jgi:hypothetical protein